MRLGAVVALVEVADGGGQLHAPARMRAGSLMWTLHTSRERLAEEAILVFAWGKRGESSACDDRINKAGNSSILTCICIIAQNHYTADADSQRPLDLTLAPLGACHGGLSDARVIREGPTISDVYYHKSTRCGGGVAPAIASGYKTCLRADPLHRSPITLRGPAARPPRRRHDGTSPEWT